MQMNKFNTRIARREDSRTIIDTIREDMVEMTGLVKNQTSKTITHLKNLP